MAVRSSSPRVVISVPPIHARPDVGLSRPAMTCMSVDFPLPDGPMIAVSRPGAMSRLTSSSATTEPSPAPYRFVTCSTRAAGSTGRPDGRGGSVRGSGEIVMIRL